MATAGVLSVSAQYLSKICFVTDNNCIRDGKNKPAVGVMISNGLNVVHTTEDGSFELPGAQNTKFIFVMNSSGYYSVKGYYIPAKHDQKDGYGFFLRAVEGASKDGKLDIPMKLPPRTADAN